MAKIQTIHKSEYNGSRVTVLGKLDFDKDGFAEIPEGKEDRARQLCINSQTLNFIEEKKQSTKELKKETPPVVKVEKPEVTPVPADLPSSPIAPEIKEEEEEVPEVTPVPIEKGPGPEDDFSTDISNEEVQALKEVLSEKNIDELRKLCEAAKIPQEEYMKEEFKGAKNKDNLIQFMVSKRVGLD